MKIAICGGTFDPFHRGHLDPILAVRDAMRWDRVIYMPAHRQPFKIDDETISGYHRFAMAVLATVNYDPLFVSPLELERGDVSYTVDTLEALHRQYPEALFDWIIGEDNVEGLAKWRHIERIFELANFVVLARGESDPTPSCAPPRSGAIIYAHNELVPISATEIRQRVRDGKPIDGFVDPLVARYIHHNGLYREANT
jgi:nicotinate-nucleotide adenylyltransferase